MVTPPPGDQPGGLSVSQNQTIAVTTEVTARSATLSITQSVQSIPDTSFRVDYFFFRCQ
jgi:hypothetical protein